MKEKKIYSLPKLSSNEFSPLRDWYVSYYYRNPFSGSMQRFRISKGLDKRVSVHLRKKRANKIIEDLTTQLKSGFSPFDEYFQPVKGPTQEMVNSPHTWKKYLLEFLIIKKTEGLKEDTIKAYSYKVKKFLKYLEYINMENHHVSLFSIKHATNFVVWLTENNCISPKTLKEYKALLSQSSKYMMKLELLKNDVFSLLPNYKGNASKPRKFTDTELKVIKSYFEKNDPQMWTAFQFVLYCFFRPNKEVRLMRVGQIDFQRGLLNSISETSKNSREESVIIPFHFLDWLKYCGYDKASKKDYMFTIDKKPGKIPIGKNYIYKRFRKFRNISGIDLYMYAAKHTGNKKLKDLGHDIIDLMKQNRHKSPNQTYEYLKSLEDTHSETLRDNYFNI